MPITVTLSLELFTPVVTVIVIWFTYRAAIHELRHNAKMQLYSRLLSHRGWMNVHFERPQDAIEFERALNAIPAVFHAEPQVLKALAELQSLNNPTDEDFEKHIVSLFRCISTTVGARPLREDDYKRITHITITRSETN